MTIRSFFILFVVIYFFNYLTSFDFKGLVNTSHAFYTDWKTTQYKCSCHSHNMLLPVPQTNMQRMVYSVSVTKLSSATCIPNKHAYIYSMTWASDDETKEIHPDR